MQDTQSHRENVFSSILSVLLVSKALLYLLSVEIIRLHF